VGPTVKLQVEPIEPASTWFSISTDQSGLIGLLCYLHGLGCTILSISRVVH
jgi:hypothetical protein